MNDEMPFEQHEINVQRKAIREQIETLLPEIFQRTLPSTGNPHDPLDDNPLNVFVEVMAHMQARHAATLEHLDRYFEIYIAPDRFVAYMASWFELESLWIDDSRDMSQIAAWPAFPTGSERLRLLLGSIRELTQWRGTIRGLTRFLEIATGVRGFLIEEEVRDEDGRVIPFEIHVHVPPAAHAYKLLIDRIVAAERPAYTTAFVLLTPPEPPEPPEPNAYRA